jgi:signal transduction histidine kinase
MATSGRWSDVSRDAIFLVNKRRWRIEPDERNHVIHSLRARLAVVLMLSIGASIALAVLMSRLYAQSLSLTEARAEDQAARACDEIRGVWRYYGSGWNGPAPAGADAAFRADLRAVLALALDRGDFAVGGIWQADQGLLASRPAEAAALPATSVWQAVASATVQQDHDMVREATDHGDRVVVAACILGGPVPKLVAWASLRLLAGTGLAQLQLGFGVLLGLVVAITGWLGWLVVAWSRHLRHIEAALARYGASGTQDTLPLIPATGELELDRIVDALNFAGTRLGAVQREAAELAVRVAGAERMAALGRVAAGVAHEIRNPIATMRLRAENALAGDDERRRTALDSILAQIARLDRLLAEMLAMTQGRAPEPACIDLASFLQATLRDYEDAAQRAQVTLQLDAPDRIEVRLDASMIGRALANLVQNAVRATPPGGRVVLAGARVGSTSAIVISVADDGTGVDEALHTRLFEPFVTGRADGTGLGLAIARELVASHGGTLRLCPGAPGTGARFVIELPGAAGESCNPVDGGSACR